MADYVKGTQNHLDIVPVGAAAAGDVVPIAECADMVAVYTRSYAAGSNAAAAYSGVFRFPTALAATDVGTRVGINDAGAAIAAGIAVRFGTVTRATLNTADPLEVAINVIGVGVA